MRSPSITKIRMRMALYLSAISEGQATYGKLMNLKISALLRMCIIDLKEKNPKLFAELSSDEYNKHFKLNLLKNYFNEKRLCINPKSIKKMKENGNFYKSPKWLAIRYEAILKFDGFCLCCGNRPTKNNPLHVDHIKPRSRYPELQYDLDNLQILCKQCNLGKGSLDETDWRQPEVSSGTDSLVREPL